MRQLAMAAVEALGLRLCAAHVEFILTDDGPKLLEVGLRPGGHRARVLHEAHGVSFMAAYAAVLRGEVPDLAERSHSPFGIVTPFPRQEGVFAGLNDVERLTGLSSYLGHSVYHSPGKIIGTAAQGYWQVLSAELTADSTPELVQDMLSVWEMDDLVRTEDVEPGPGNGGGRRPHLLLIGGKDSGFASLAELDLRITLVQERANVSALQSRRADTLVLYERLDDDTATRTAEFLHEHGDEPFDAVLSFAEKFLLTAATVGERLSLVHNPRSAVERSTDKLRTRELLRAYGLPTVAYRACRSAAEVAAFRAELTAARPAGATDTALVLKPASGAGSRGVSLVAAEAQLAAGWEVASAAGMPVIAEEYVVGQEVSVETLTVEGKHEVLAITEKVTSGAPAFVETGHQLPAELPVSVRELLADTTTRLLDALGHTWGPAHTELRIRESGEPVVIETQTRFGGDQIWQMVELVTGVRLAAATAAAMLDTHGPTRVEPVAEAASIRYLAHEHGVVSAVGDPARVREMPGVVSVGLSAAVGQRLGPLGGSGSRQGHVLATGSTRTEAVERAERGLHAIGFRVAP